MRSCIYCGKTLAKDEVCNCAQAVKHREEKERAQKANDASAKNTSYTDTSSTTYHTGYSDTGEKKHKKERVKKERPKKEHAQKAWRDTAGGFKSQVNDMKRGGFRELFADMRRFCVRPLDGVAYPENLSTLKYVIMSLINSLLLGLGVYFLRIGFAGGKRFTGLLSVFLSSDINLGSFFAGWVQYSVFVLILLYLLWFVFFLTDKILMKTRIKFADFLPRFVSATIPVTFVCLIGAVLSLFSIYASAMFTGVGVVMFIILTYEALKVQWSSRGSNAVLYTMSVGYLIFFIFMFNLWRIM